MDSGCTDSMIRSGLVEGNGKCSKIVAFDGREIVSKGLALVEVYVNGMQLRLNMIVVEDMIEDFDVVFPDFRSPTYLEMKRNSFGEEIIQAAQSILKKRKRVRFNIPISNDEDEDFDEINSMPIAE